MIEITLHLPAVERLCDILEKQGGLPSTGGTPAATTGRTRTPRSTPAKDTDPEPDITPTPEPDITPTPEPDITPTPDPVVTKPGKAPKHSVESLTKLGREYITLTDITAFRKFLDGTIGVGVKISDMPAEKYDVLGAALEKAVEDNSAL